jgi:hypothetical protein
VCEVCPAIHASTLIRTGYVYHSSLRGQCFFRAHLCSSSSKGIGLSFYKRMFTSYAYLPLDKTVKWYYGIHPWFTLRLINAVNKYFHTGCSFYRIITSPEHLISWKTERHSFGDHLFSVSPCYAIECDRSFFCSLFCVCMTRVGE